MRVVRVLWLVGSLLAVAGCADEEASSDDLPGANAPYALLRDDDWSLQEAVDPAADDRFASIERPPLDWYGEYLRATPSGSQMVRLSGHRATFEDARSELEDLGFAFHDVHIDGWRGVGGTAADDPAGPAVVLLDNGRSSLIVLSYEVDLDTLTQLAAAIEAVDETSWVEAGGVIR